MYKDIHCSRWSNLQCGLLSQWHHLCATSISESRNRCYLYESMGWKSILCSKYVCSRERLIDTDVYPAASGSGTPAATSTSIQTTAAPPAPTSDSWSDFLWVSLDNLGIRGFRGKNSGIGSWFRTRNPADDTNGRSWCQLSYKDDWMGCRFTAKNPKMSSFVFQLRPMSQ